MSTSYGWPDFRTEFQKLLDRDPRNASMEAVFGADYRRPVKPATVQLTPVERALGERYGLTDQDWPVEALTRAWGVRGGSDDGQDEFLLLAARAAVLLGHSESGGSTWTPWVEHVATVSDRVDQRAEFSDDLGRFEQVRVIPNVCLASADACLLLATERKDVKPRSSAKQSRESYPDRAAWLRREMQKRRITTAHRLMTVGGPEKHTVQKVLEGRPVSDDVLRKLAEGLSYTRPPVTVDQIPRT